MRTALAVSSVLIAVGAAPPVAAGQDGAAFARAAIDLTLALAGTYGDEGPQASAALDAMARALTAWDRNVRDLEDRADAASRGAPPQVASRLWSAVGLAFLERGRTRDAIRALEEASQYEPRDAMPHLVRGLALYSADAPDPAAMAFRRAFDLDRQDPIAAYWVVQSAPEARQSDEAREALDALAAAYRRALETARTARTLQFPSLTLLRDDAAGVPIFPLQSYQQGYALIARGEYRRAIALLRETAAADPLVADPALRTTPLLQGGAALRQGRPAAAIVLLDQALARAPASSEIHRLLGTAHRAAGRIEDGIAHLESALRLDPASERARLGLVAALLDLADRDGDARPRARRAIDEALAAIPASGALHWMAAAFHRGIDDGEALRRLEAAAAAYPVAGRRAILADIGRLQADADETARTFRRAVLLSPNDPRAHLDLGETQRTQGLAGPALASFVAAMLIAPDIAEGHAAVGQVYLAMGRAGDAVAAFRRAAALGPAEIGTHYGLAAALRQIGAVDEAAAALERFERLQHSAIETTRQEMEQARAARDAALDDEVAARQAIVDREPANPVHRLQLGEALLRQGQIARGIGHLELAAALGAPREVFLLLAGAYAALGRAEESAGAQTEYERRGGGEIPQPSDP